MQIDFSEVGLPEDTRRLVQSGTHSCAQIAKVLKQHGLEPAPKRVGETTWKELFYLHWELIVAADFFTAEAWKRRGLQLTRI